ncbi:PREDICTED: olfactory receptor 3A2-like [Myotis davidii]|uniref:olfactory receptor 3A2-like n=1 Tax=Myotis davidii TaxID=225400 RepID=UPI0003EBC2A2|nr:PREDICTED: olfactory receptor 3A2-like [Myotis davidii]
METEPGANGTAVTEFILLGLVDTPELLPLVFVLFLFAYLLTVGGNLSILAAILVEPKLHTPMYFFLGNLSVLDVGCITVINPFHCDLPQLFQLSCSSTQLNELLLFGLGILMAGAPVVLIVTSYIHVAAAVLRIRSVEGRKKAFSTCGSHLTVVGIFYGTGIFSYMRLGSVEASDKDKGIGILNTVISPMLNPLIYSLRNPDVQGALRKVLMGKRAPA